MLFGEEFEAIFQNIAGRRFGARRIRRTQAGDRAGQNEPGVIDSRRSRQGNLGQFAIGSIDYLKPVVQLAEGDASYVVPEKATELGADLVVMGTLARTGIAGLLMGNTAESILMQLDCSVLTVKPPGFVSPITLRS